MNGAESLATRPTTGWIYEGFSWRSIAFAGLFLLGVLVIGFDALVLRPERENRQHVVRSLQTLGAGDWAGPSDLRFEIWSGFSGRGRWFARLPVRASDQDALLDAIRASWQGTSSGPRSGPWPTLISTKSAWWRPDEHADLRIVTLMSQEKTPRPIIYIGASATSGAVFVDETY